MLRLAINFPLGRYHADRWGSHTNEGQLDWPPSPWRILRALYAVSHTNVSFVDERDAIDALISQLTTASVPTYVVPTVGSAHTRHYMPGSKYSRHESGDTDKIIDSFITVDEDSQLEVIWPDIDLDQSSYLLLERLCKAVGYLGRGESCCEIRVVAEGNPEPAAANAQPIDSYHGDFTSVLGDGFEERQLLCFKQGVTDPIAVVTQSVPQLRKQRYRMPAGVEWVSYRVPKPLAAGESVTKSTFIRPKAVAPTYACFRVVGGNRPGIYNTVTMAERFRNALQSLYGKDGTKGGVFSGHNPDGSMVSGHSHAHFVSLPDLSVGRRGVRVDHVHIWASEGFNTEAQRALRVLSRVSSRGEGDPYRVSLLELSEKPKLFIGPSKVWSSFTPLRLSRHLRGVKAGESVTDSQVFDDLQDQVFDFVKRELGYRPWLADVANALERVELTKGLIYDHLSRHQFKLERSGKSSSGPMQSLTLRLHFSDPVEGPFFLGALSHFGLGVFLPQGSES